MMTLVRSSRRAGRGHSTDSSAIKHAEILPHATKLELAIRRYDTPARLDAALDHMIDHVIAELRKTARSAPISVDDRTARPGRCACGEHADRARTSKPRRHRESLASAGA
jgi:hypothetical protein